MKLKMGIFIIPFFFNVILKAKEKPNILWITIEDTSPQFIGCYGNKNSRTPVIDKLAQEGIRFQNAFSTGTVCSPSRSTIITGVRTYKTILEKMRGQLETKIFKARDILFLPEYEIGLIAETDNPYEFRLDNKKYPFDEIYKAASLSGFKGRKVVKQQIELLESPNKIVRYWAVTGLQSQNQEDLKPYFNTLKHAINDGYPPVEITASVILYELSHNNTAEKKLKEYCNSANSHLSLMAINNLFYVGDKQPFIELVRSVREKESQDYTVKKSCMDFLGILGLVPNDIEHRE